MLKPKKKKSPSTEQTKNSLKNAGISYHSDIKNAINAATNKAKSYDQNKPHPKEDFGSKGTYTSSDKGRVGRTTPSGTSSIDTSGYSKGKSSFSLQESKPGFQPTYKTISREEVKPMINSFKKGATREVQFKNGQMIEKPIKRPK
jgi:hypothetical protein